MVDGTDLMTMALVHDTYIYVHGFLHIHPTQYLSCIVFISFLREQKKMTERNKTDELQIQLEMGDASYFDAVLPRHESHLVKSNKLCKRHL